MRIARATGWKPAAAPLLLAAALLAGCGGSDGGGPEPEPECAISAVTTGLADSWLTGETVEIRWTRNGVPSTVLIELLKAGAVVDTIAVATANDGFHAWMAATGGQANGSDFGIRVSGTGVPACSAQITGLTITDVSGCNIVIPPFGADDDTVTAGIDYTLEWDSFHTSGAVDIELYKSLPNTLGDFVGTIVFGATDVGSFTWTVDSFHQGSLFYRYRIVDSQVGGCEAISSPFYMIDEELCLIDVYGPAENQSYNEGDLMSIDVDQVNGSGLVNLRLYSGQMFVPGGFIAQNYSVLDPPLEWTIDDYGWTLSTSSYKIKAFDVDDDYCVGETGRFTIIGN